MEKRDLPEPIQQAVRKGMVIPAHPLALTEQRKLDEKHQRALTRYYLDAGAGGIAVGVHTTQFEIRLPQHGLLAPVLALAAETAEAWSTEHGKPVFKVAGICGQTPQAVREAGLAMNLGYHAGLLNLAALPEATIPQLLDHCRAVAEIIPVIGFYLQPAAGGRLLSYEFWRGFAEIENAMAIKIAAFNRYQTLDVVRALAEAGREKEIALYTGNDDNIVVDLLSTYRIQTATGKRCARFVGGLLGHWAVGTRSAVQLLREIHEIVETNQPVPQSLLTRAIEVTDANAAFFDAAHQFAGCIPGIHERLRRQGLMPGNWCLNPVEVLSSGQKEEIDRVCQAYPHLNDDVFVQENLDAWLKG